MTAARARCRTSARSADARGAAQAPGAPVVNRQKVHTQPIVSLHGRQEVVALRH